MTLHPAAAGWVFVCGVSIPCAAAADLPDIERGRALYDNHCIVCHGKSVHARPGKTPPTRAELRLIIDEWQQAEHLRWSEEEVRDVSAFLEQVVYRDRR